MTDLREKLALSLWTRLLREHPHLYRDSEFPSENQYGTLWTCADECIRQMEWAAREARAESRRLITQKRHPASYFVNIEGIIHAHDELWSLNLGAAPDDLTPKEPAK